MIFRIQRVFAIGGLRGSILGLAMLISACGSSGGTAGGESQPLALDQVPVQVVAQVNLNAASGYFGPDVLFYNLLGQGDINGDGFDDLVIGLFRHSTSSSYSGRQFDPSGEIRPVVLFYNPATDVYEVKPQLQSVIRPNQHPRQVAIADFDGDGRKDVFIADHGYDDAPYGHQNTLLLNKASGFVDGTSLLPSYADFSHGLVMADLDGDGRPDLLVLNNRLEAQTKCEKYPGFKDCTGNPPKYPQSYVLYNRGAAGLVQGVLDIPDAVINFKSTTDNPDLRLYVGHTADFNRDGLADLVVSNHRQLFVVESAGQGKYVSAQPFSPPATARAACRDFMPYTAMNSLDLDGDGRPEILAAYGCGLEGVAFQVFKRSATGVWADATEALVGDQAANEALSDGWCYKLGIADVNNDGVQDVICQGVRGLGLPTNNVFWFGGSKLQFSGISLQGGAWSNFQTVVQNKFGTYVLGLKNQMGQSDLSVLRWKVR